MNKIIEKALELSKRGETIAVVLGHGENRAFYVIQDPQTPQEIARFLHRSEVISGGRCSLVTVQNHVTFKEIKENE